MPLFESIKIQEKVDLARNLSLLIKSGVSINRSFEILETQSSSETMKKFMKKGKERVERGSSISQVFEENKNFRGVFTSFIKAGEEAGSLTKNLDFLTDWMEKDSTLKKEVKSATLYPKIIIVFAVVLGTGLTMFVLPRLIPVFGTLGVTLPISTRMLLWTSEFFMEYGVQSIIGLIIFSILFYLFLKIKLIKKVVHKIIIKVPIVGPLVKNYQLAIISQLTSTLLMSGATINRTLDVVVDSATNYEYKKALEDVKKRVITGTSIVEALKGYPKLFPPIFLNIVMTGEETGSIANSFDYLSNFFTAKVKEKTKSLPVVIEPVLLLLIGVFVAFIASAIIFPIYEVTKGL